MIFHLRRIGPEATRPENSNYICFRRIVTIIGRSRSQVDYIICSRDPQQNSIISRCHCRVRHQGTTLKLFDDSRNGIFVNNVKIAGETELLEGDTVTFGHPRGEYLPTGTRVRQLDSEFQYILEICTCDQSTQAGAGEGTSQTTAASSLMPPPRLPPVLPSGAPATVTNTASSRLLQPTKQHIKQETPGLSNATEPSTSRTLPGKRSTTSNAEIDAGTSDRQTTDVRDAAPSDILPITISPIHPADQSSNTFTPNTMITSEPEPNLRQNKPPVVEEPVVEEPMPADGDKLSVVEEPVDEEPMPAHDDKPSVVEEPVVEEPMPAHDDKPSVVEEPVVEEPMPAHDDKPSVVEEPMPAHDDKPSVVEEPVVEEPMPVHDDKPSVVEEPVVEEPMPAHDDKPSVVEEPVVEEPMPAHDNKPSVVEEPIPAHDDKLSVVEEPVVEEPIPAHDDKPSVVEEPMPAHDDKPSVVEEPVVEEPMPAHDDKPSVVEEPVVEEPMPAHDDKPSVVEEPVVEEPMPAHDDKPSVVEEPVVEEPMPADEDKPSVVEEPVVEEPVVEEPVVEEPMPADEDKPSVVEEPVVEEPMPADDADAPISPDVAEPRSDDVKGAIAVDEELVSTDKEKELISTDVNRGSMVTVSEQEPIPIEAKETSLADSDKEHRTADVMEPTSNGRSKEKIADVEDMLTADGVEPLLSGDVMETVTPDQSHPTPSTINVNISVSSDDLEELLLTDIARKSIPNSNEPLCADEKPSTDEDLKAEILETTDDVRGSNQGDKFLAPEEDLLKTDAKESISTKTSTLPEEPIAMKDVHSEEDSESLLVPVISKDPPLTDVEMTEGIQTDDVPQKTNTLICTEESAKPTSPAAELVGNEALSDSSKSLTEAKPETTTNVDIQEKNAISQKESESKREQSPVWTVTVSPVIDVVMVSHIDKPDNVNQHTLSATGTEICSVNVAATEDCMMEKMPSDALLTNQTSECAEPKAQITTSTVSRLSDHAPVSLPGNSDAEEFQVPLLPLDPVVTEVSNCPTESVESKSTCEKSVLTEGSPIKPLGRPLHDMDTFGEESQDESISGTAENYSEDIFETRCDCDIETGAHFEGKHKVCPSSPASIGTNDCVCDIDSTAKSAHVNPRDLATETRDCTGMNHVTEGDRVTPGNQGSESDDVTDDKETDVMESKSTLDKEPKPNDVKELFSSDVKESIPDNQTDNCSILDDDSEDKSQVSVSLTKSGFEETGTITEESDLQITSLVSIDREVVKEHRKREIPGDFSNGCNDIHVDVTDTDSIKNSDASKNDSEPSVLNSTYCSSNVTGNANEVNICENKENRPGTDHSNVKVLMHEPKKDEGATQSVSEDHMPVCVDKIRNEKVAVTKVQPVPVPGTPDKIETGQKLKLKPSRTDSDKISATFSGLKSSTSEVQVASNISQSRKRPRTEQNETANKRYCVDVPFLLTTFRSPLQSPGIGPRIASLPVTPVSASSYAHSLLLRDTEDDAEEHQFSDAESDEPENLVSSDHDPTAQTEHQTTNNPSIVFETISCKRKRNEDEEYGSKKQNIQCEVVDTDDDEHVTDVKTITVDQSEQLPTRNVESCERHTVNMGFVSSQESDVESLHLFLDSAEESEHNRVSLTRKESYLDSIDSDVESTDDELMEGVAWLPSSSQVCVEEENKQSIDEDDCTEPEISVERSSDIQIFDQSAGLAGGTQNLTDSPDLTSNCETNSVEICNPENLDNEDMTETNGDLVDTGHETTVEAVEEQTGNLGQSPCIVANQKVSDVDTPSLESEGDTKKVDICVDSGLCSEQEPSEDQHEITESVDTDCDTGMLLEEPCDVPLTDGDVGEAAVSSMDSCETPGQGAGETAASKSEACDDHETFQKVHDAAGTCQDELKASVILKRESPLITELVHETPVACKYAIETPVLSQYVCETPSLSLQKCTIPMVSQSVCETPLISHEMNNPTVKSPEIPVPAADVCIIREIALESEGETYSTPCDAVPVAQLVTGENMYCGESSDREKAVQKVVHSESCENTKNVLETNDFVTSVCEDQAVTVDPKMCFDLVINKDSCPELTSKDATEQQCDNAGMGQGSIGSPIMENTLCDDTGNTDAEEPLVSMETTSKNAPQSALAIEVTDPDVTREMDVEQPSSMSSSQVFDTIDTADLDAGKTSNIHMIDHKEITDFEVDLSSKIEGIDTEETTDPNVDQISDINLNELDKNTNEKVNQTSNIEVLDMEETTDANVNQNAEVQVIEMNETTELPDQTVNETSSHNQVINMEDVPDQNVYDPFRNVQLNDVLETMDKDVNLTSEVRVTEMEEVTEQTKKTQTTSDGTIEVNEDSTSNQNIQTHTTDAQEDANVLNVTEHLLQDECCQPVSQESDSTTANCTELGGEQLEADDILLTQPFNVSKDFEEDELESCPSPIGSEDHVAHNSQEEYQAVGASQTIIDEDPTFKDVDTNKTVGKDNTGQSCDEPKLADEEDTEAANASTSTASMSQGSVDMDLAPTQVYSDKTPDGASQESLSDGLDLFLEPTQASGTEKPSQKTSVAPSQQSVTDSLCLFLEPTQVARSETSHTDSDKTRKISDDDDALFTSLMHDSEDDCNSKIQAIISALEDDDDDITSSANTFQTRETGEVALTEESIPETSEDLLSNKIATDASAIVQGTEDANVEGQACGSMTGPADGEDFVNTKQDIQTKEQRKKGEPGQTDGSQKFNNSIDSADFGAESDSTVVNSSFDSIDGKDRYDVHDYVANSVDSETDIDDELSQVIPHTAIFKRAQRHKTVCPHSPTQHAEDTGMETEVMSETSPTVSVPQHRRPTLAHTTSATAPTSCESEDTEVDKRRIPVKRRLSATTSTSCESEESDKENASSKLPPTTPGRSKRSLSLGKRRKVALTSSQEAASEGSNVVEDACPSSPAEVPGHGSVPSESIPIIRSASPDYDMNDETDCEDECYVGDEDSMDDDNVNNNDTCNASAHVDTELLEEDVDDEDRDEDEMEHDEDSGEECHVEEEVDASEDGDEDKVQHEQSDEDDSEEECGVERSEDGEEEVDDSEDGREDGDRDRVEHEQSDGDDQDSEKESDVERSGDGEDMEEKVDDSEDGREDEDEDKVEHEQSDGDDEDSEEERDVERSEDVEKEVDDSEDGRKDEVDYESINGSLSDHYSLMSSEDDSRKDGVHQDEEDEDFEQSSIHPITSDSEGDNDMDLDNEDIDAHHENISLQGSNSQSNSSEVLQTHPNEISVKSPDSGPYDIPDETSPMEGRSPAKCVDKPFLIDCSSNVSDLDIFSCPAPEEPSTSKATMEKRSPKPDFTEAQPSGDLNSESCGWNDSSDNKKSVSSVLAKIRAKKRLSNIVMATPDTTQVKTEHQSSSQETPGGVTGEGSAARRALVPHSVEDDVARADDQSQRCRAIIQDMSMLLRSKPQLNPHARVKAWQIDVDKLREKLQMPQTIIAVVGDTGSGKSSLMNALLDHADILPTSGMRACTAVVVEINNNRTSNRYEADIEFLSEKEWNDELTILLNELIGRDGQVKAYQPDPKSDAGVAWSKIRAVYGPFKDGVTQAKLSRNRTVTRWLSKTRRITDTQPKRFRQEIDRYIESTDTGTGGDYWPIVKHVKIRIPKCEVCRSGATLIDLPGIRDSNAARDKIAKDFLKNCTAVWVVASIHRAVDDKTAKDLLGEHFRRQLLMDGQYGSVSFVCTKTDILVPSEIIRGLKLKDEVAALETEIQELEVKDLDLKKELDEAKEEKNELQDARGEIETELRGIEDELTQAQEIGNEDESRRLGVVLAENRQTLDDVQGRIKDLRRTRRKLNQELVENSAQMEIQQKAITTLCAKARNDYSKSQIRKDFRAGLREMKRQAGIVVEEEEEDVEAESSGPDDDHIKNTVENLNVFSVSALEYLKLKKKLPKKDGEAQVFSSTMDTGIPSLQEFVHALTKKRQVDGTKRLVRCIGQTVADVHSYLADEGTKDRNMRGSAKSVFVTLLSKLNVDNIGAVIQKASDRIDQLFDKNLKCKTIEGMKNAVNKAPETVAKWGSKENRENPPAGGYHWKTYQATVRRDGAYKSPKRGPVDFNEDLAGPMYASITIVWDKIFNSSLFNILETAKKDLLDALVNFGVEMHTQLCFLGVQPDRVLRVRQQQITGASNKLSETVRVIQEFITTQQREVSRVVTPSVQTQMLPAYQVCAAQAGQGTSDRMKSHMAAHVAMGKNFIFDAASQELFTKLQELQNEVVAQLRIACEGILRDLTALYEPLWEAPDHTRLLRSNYLQGVLEVCRKLTDLYKDLDLEANPEYDVLISKHVVSPSTSAATSSDVKKVPNTETLPTRPVVQVKQELNVVPGPSKELLSILRNKVKPEDQTDTKKLMPHYVVQPPTPLISQGQSKTGGSTIPVVRPTGRSGGSGLQMPQQLVQVAPRQILVIPPSKKLAPRFQPTSSSVIPPPAKRLPTDVVTPVHPKKVRKSKACSTMAVGNAASLDMCQALSQQIAQSVMANLQNRPRVQKPASWKQEIPQSAAPICGIAMGSVVKQEPLSPSKRKRTVEYISLISSSDDEDDSDVPTLKKRKQRKS